MPDGILMYLIYFFTFYHDIPDFYIFYFRVLIRILEVNEKFRFFALDIPQSLLQDHLASFERLKLS